MEAILADNEHDVCLQRSDCMQQQLVAQTVNPAHRIDKHTVRADLKRSILSQAFHGSRSFGSKSFWF